MAFAMPPDPAETAGEGDDAPAERPPASSSDEKTMVFTAIPFPNEKARADAEPLSQRKTQAQTAIDDEPEGYVTPFKKGPPKS